VSRTAEDFDAVATATNVTPPAVERLGRTVEWVDVRPRGATVFSRNFRKI